MDLINTVIDNKFEVISSLGAGGMGTVYLCTQRGLDRKVAVKLLRTEWGGRPDAEALARFEREAHALSVIKHKSIVTVYGYGTHDGFPYMAMEYVHGQSLASLLRDHEPLPIDVCLNIGIQASDALSCAHTNGIIHRDLKPNNILLTDENEVKLIDFGLAKVFDDSAVGRQQLTEAGMAVGSVLYMSPEQCLGQTADARADIYGLGCVLFHCLTGREPFTGDHSIVVMHQHLNDQLPRLSQAAPHLVPPPGLQEMLDVATAKGVESRYETAAQLQEDLVRLSKGEKVWARPSTHKPIDPLLSDAKEHSGWSRTAPLVAGVVVGVVALSFVIQHIFPSATSPQSAVKDQGSSGTLARIEQLEARLAYGAMPEIERHELDFDLGRLYAAHALEPGTTPSKSHFDLKSAAEYFARAIETPDGVRGLAMAAEIAKVPKLNPQKKDAILGAAIRLASNSLKRQPDCSPEQMRLYADKIQALIADVADRDVREVRALWTDLMFEASNRACREDDYARAKKILLEVANLYDRNWPDDPAAIGAMTQVCEIDSEQDPAAGAAVLKQTAVRLERLYEPTVVNTFQYAAAGDHLVRTMMAYPGWRTSPADAARLAATVGERASDYEPRAAFWLASCKAAGLFCGGNAKAAYKQLQPVLPEARGSSRPEISVNEKAVVLHTNYVLALLNGNKDVAHQSLNEAYKLMDRSPERLMLLSRNTGKFYCVMLRSGKVADAERLFDDFRKFSEQHAKTKDEAEFALINICSPAAVDLPDVVTAKLAGLAENHKIGRVSDGVAVIALNSLSIAARAQGKTAIADAYDRRQLALLKEVPSPASMRHQEKIKRRLGGNASAPHNF